MLRPRRLLVLSLAAVVVGLAVGFWLLWPRDAPCDERHGEMKLGLTRAGLVELLGDPDPFPPSGKYQLREQHGDRRTAAKACWYGRRIAIEAYLDHALAEHIAAQDDRVVSFMVLDVIECDRPTPLDQVRRWLGF